MYDLIWKYLMIFWQIFFKTICIRRKCFKLLKLASTTGEMFENTLFSHCWSNLLHSWHKYPIFDVELSIYQLIFHSKAVFYYSTAFIFYIRSKKHHFCDSKHFHDSRFNFNDMNVQSTTVDLISTCFMQHIRLKCKK